MILKFIQAVYLEEFLGMHKIKAYFKPAGINAGIYKNPKTVSKMMPYLRGIITKKGDLYVVDYDYDPRTGIIIHADLVAWMNDNIAGFHSNYALNDSKKSNNPGLFINEMITVQRFGSNNKRFVMAESYFPMFLRKKTTLAKLERYKKAFEKVNPQFELDLSEYYPDENEED